MLHPGHIRHFKEAKAQGDLLVVSVTPDRFVNKGPGRPAFTETLRLESLAELGDIDYVVLNDMPDAISAIQKIRPSIYVKGSEYQDHAKDVTGKIAEEVLAVESLDGKIYYTDDIVFSSSSLINQYINPLSPQATEFIKNLKTHHSSEEILSQIEALSQLKVLVIGDAIIDEYQFVDPLGQSGKGLHMTARCLEKEVFLGGSLIMANHIAQFAGEVTLVTALGKECPYRGFVLQNLNSKIKLEEVLLEDASTLVKKRYVLKDGNTITKLFETYSSPECPLSLQQVEKITRLLADTGSRYDLVLACDFGNGFTNPQITDAISEVSSFLALNTQTNSGNRGFNLVTNYKRADYISLNEPEVRLAAHDRFSALEGIAADIGQLMGNAALSVTRGVRGVVCYDIHGAVTEIPALTTTSVDRIGAGDSYLSLSSLCLAKGLPLKIAGFLGSVAAAMSVQMIGNQEPIRKVPFCKFVTRLMK